MSSQEASGKLHRRSIVLDGHTDTLQRVFMEDDLLDRRSDRSPLVDRCDMPRFREGGVDAQLFAVWIDTIYLPDHCVRRALQLIDAFWRMVDGNQDMVLARTGADARAAFAKGQFAAFLAIEGGDAIASDLGVLRLFHRLGASSMTLCHSRSTDWVDSSTDEPKWGGLNDFGCSVLREMNRLGMVIDVSHTSDDAVRAALDVSDAPIIASHSSCHALCDHPRNLNDELLRGIAAKGGVVGINFFSGFLDGEWLKTFRATHADLLTELNTPPQIADGELDQVARERFYEICKDSLPRPRFETILDHIDHAVEVAGVDHVGLGSDLDCPYLSTPEGFDDVTAFPRITDGLVERGYDEASIRKILGENFIRVFDDVAEAAG